VSLKLFLALGSLLLPGTAAALGQTSIPDWCKSLPRAEYKSLERVQISDPWFEVYKVAPDTFAIYEPHQFEETISYLILGKQNALLFDTGMGIGDLREVVSELTQLPVSVLNSHTHNDHVGSNWQFETIYSLDTEFSRENAKGSTTDAQAELAPGQVCGELPKDFDPKNYRTKPWTITKYVHDRDRIELGGRTLEIITAAGHTPDSLSLYDQANELLFTGDTYYPGPIWLYRPETDLLQYSASVGRLALWAREARVLLGAHNVPVAPSTVLPILNLAAGELQPATLRKKGHCKPAGTGKQVCDLEGISFLLRADR